MKAFEIMEKYQSLEYKRLETLRAMDAVKKEFAKDFSPYTDLNWSERNAVYKILDKYIESIINEIHELGREEVE